MNQKLPFTPVEVPFGGARLQVRTWRLEAHAENVDLNHHVRLCLEGLPLHAWDEHAVVKAIGSGCTLDYIEPASKLKTQTRVLGLWAWTTCPSRVPRVNWITLPARDGGEPIYGRRGLKHQVLIHLAIHEDPTSGSIISTPYDWLYHVVDGETRPRDRRERVSRPVQHHRRDRDEDDDRRRGGRDGDRGRDQSRPGGSGWGASLRRSLSRVSRDERQDRDRGRESRGDRDGGRRRDGLGTEPVMLLASGSGSDVAGRLAENTPALRGRSLSRPPSPALAGQLSRDEMTPPASPPLSPTTVLPMSPRSKRSEAAVAAQL